MDFISGRKVWQSWSHDFHVITGRIPVSADHLFLERAFWKGKSSQRKLFGGFLQRLWNFRRLSGVALCECMSLWYASRISSQHQQSVTKSFLCTVHNCTTEMFQDVSELFWKGYVVFPWKKTIKKSFLVWKERPHWLLKNTVCSQENVSTLCGKPQIIIPPFLQWLLVYKHFYMHPIIFSPDLTNT